MIRYGTGLWMGLNYAQLSTTSNNRVLRLCITCDFSVGKLCQETTTLDQFGMYVCMYIYILYFIYYIYYIY